MASLDEKYDNENGAIFLNGSQALVRACLDQAAADRAAGLNTAGFVSGYRGSPLGNVDTAFMGAAGRLSERHIRFQPGVNEELAATSCWGTQQVGQFPDPKYDGVFALWYGKGPGVDRAGDALKHGNLAGTARHGGVVVVAGDDHSAKSSTTAHQSEQALIAAMIPILYPATTQDILEFGRHAFELSRFAGLWTGLKCVTEVVETAATCAAASAVPVARPDVAWPPSGAGIGRGFAPAEDERHLIRYRLPAAQAYVRANRLDRIAIDSEKRTLGLVAAGKAFTDTLAALRQLGITADRAAALGLRLYKPALVWPLEPEGITGFARSHAEILVVEEKRPVIASQLAELLFNMPSAERPSLSGKSDPVGAFLLPADGELSPAIIATAIAARLNALRPDGWDEPARATRPASVLTAPALRRTPAFCSGCPHNSSTKTPAGSVALAGIGCHSMALFMPDRPTMPPVQMGGEGANWIGAAPFTGTNHIFQNLGDGTYFHSGLLAIRAAVAADVNITFKILFNDAVAMTGGQPIDGELSVAAIVDQVRAEGVGEILVVTDEPEKYGAGLAEQMGVAVHGRGELLAIEARLRHVAGTSVLVYDQACAAEKRRRRKRGTFPDPAKRYFINDLVCEGCGDCSVQSNCVSIQPVETEFGRKRRIDQSSCNKDFSCAEGFCPSFVTISGGAPRRRGGADAGRRIDAALADIPAPTPRAFDRSLAILIAGIGGTGVVTIGAILGMAAKIDGIDSSVLDITGLSQKNGAVLSHLKLAPGGQGARSSRIGRGEADLLIGCDLVVAGSIETLDTLRAGVTDIVVNRHMVATAAFQANPDLEMEAGEFIEALAAGSRSVVELDATQIAERAFGNHIAANMFLAGVAFQLGHIPLSERSILAAIGLNNVAVDMNRRAFGLGRLAALGSPLVGEFGGAAAELVREETLDTLVARRAAFLRDYQDAAYAARFRETVGLVSAAEEKVAPGESRLAIAAARSLFKLMAYKDEYEVARLHMDTGLRDRIAAEFEGDVRISYNFAPPLFARRDPHSGFPKKRAFGAWIETPLRLLSRARRLRGTVFDIFGYTEERRTERRLRDEFDDLLRVMATRLTGDNLPVAFELAKLPMAIRGFGHVKMKNLAAVEAKGAELRARFDAAHTPQQKAKEKVTC